VTGLSKTATATVTNITTSLNVRKGPSTKDAVIGSLKNNAAITITGYTTDGWLRMKTSSISLGYVSAQYVRVPVVSVSLAAATATVVTGKTAQARATVLPECATNKSVTWASSNAAVASVNASGVVTGWKDGKVTITARTSDGGKTASAVYTVTGSAVAYVAVTDVSLAQPAPVMAGRTRQVTATVAPANASNKGLTWTTSSTSAATISSGGLLTGKLTGLGKSTTITVTAKAQDNGTTATTSVLVYTVQDVQARLNTVGCKGTNGSALVVDGVIGTQSTAAIKNFQGVAGLTKDGLAGPQTLAALFGSPAPSCTGASVVTQPTPSPSPTPSGTPPPPTNGGTTPVTGVTVTPGQPILVGNTLQLAATVAPANATNPGVTWSTNSASIATVNTSGLVTGIIKGTGKSAAATITVATADGGKTASTSVMVYTAQDVQVKLNSLTCRGANNAALTVDGAIGSNSKAALRDFQVANNLTANGLVSSDTLAALFGKSPKACPVVSNSGLDLTGFQYKWSGKYVTQDFLNKVLDIAKKLQANPDDLMADMAFESGLNPYAQNASSQATGLIQFMPSTAVSLGTTTEKLLEMTAVQQLDYVYKYLQRFTGKLNSLSDVVVAVLWPAAVGQPDSYILFSQGGGAYAGNSGLDLNKDGNVTKGEAAQRAIAVRDSYGKR